MTEIVVNDTEAQLQSIRQAFSLTIKHEAPLPKAMNLIREVIENYSATTRQKNITITVSQITLSGITLNITYWIVNPTDLVEKVHSDILMEIKTRFDKADIYFSTGG